MNYDQYLIIINTYSCYLHKINILRNNIKYLDILRHKEINIVLYLHLDRFLKF